MKARIGWLVLLVGALLVPSLARAQPCESQAHVSAAKAAIAQVWSQFETARNGGDASAWLDLWDDNAIYVSSGSEAVAGLAGLRNAVSWGSEDAVLDLRLQETEVFGPLAYSRVAYTKDVLDHRGGVVDRTDGSFLSVLRQQADGSWKIYRHVEHVDPMPD